MDGTLLQMLQVHVIFSLHGSLTFNTRRRSQTDIDLLSLIDLICIRYRNWFNYLFTIVLDGNQLHHLETNGEKIVVQVNLGEGLNCVFQKL